MYPLYYGNTQTISGSTALDSKAILNVQEGYHFGGTVEYINKGDYEVENMTKGGAFNQELNLSASAPVSRLDANNNLVPRVYQSIRQIYSPLDTDSGYNSDFNTYEGFLGVTNSMLRTSNPTGKAISYVNDIQDSENFRIITTVKSSLLNSQSLVQLRARYNADSNEGYVLSYNGSNKQFRIQRSDGTLGLTALSGISLGVSNNTNYTFMFVGTQGNLRGYWGVTNTGLTLGVSALDYRYVRGGIGFAGAGVSSVIDFKDFEFSEIGDYYNTDDIVRNIFAMGDVWNLKTYTQGGSISLAGASDAGSSWVYGVTNGERMITIVNTSVGQSWHILPLSFDRVDIMGTSGNIAGIGAQVFRFGGGSLNNWLEVTGTNGTSIVRFTNRSQYITLLPDRWYTVKVEYNPNGLTPGGQLVNYYVNNMLTGTLVTYPRTKQDVGGLMAFRTGVSGTVTNFKNFVSLRLYETVPFTQIDNGQPLSSALSRALPQGFIVISGGTQTEIMLQGSSRGSVSLSTASKSNITSITEAVSNTTGDKHTIGFSDDSVDIEYQDGFNKRPAYQTDSARYGFITDQNIQTGSALETITFEEMVSNNRDIERLELTITPRVHIQSQDYIGTVGDTYLGLSVGRNYMIESFTTEYDSRGLWRQSLILADQQ